MTTKKPAAKSRGKSKKLKLKKETVKDLDAKSQGRGVKAGVYVVRTLNCTDNTCVTCTCATCLGVTCACLKA